MSRHFPAIGVFLLLLGLAGSASAQSFGDVVVFGDSLSDTGNVAQQLNLPAGSSFTTNPDPISAAIIARTFGASSKNSLAGGPNHAWGGACMNPDGPCLQEAVPTIPEQIDGYLSARPGGRADSRALYLVWGGVNDIDAAATADLLLGTANAQSHTLAAADVAAAQIRRLQEAGARHIVVYNLPNIGLTPFAATFPATTRAVLSALSKAYNERLRAGLRGREEGIIPINISGAIEEIAADPEGHGITHVAGTACRPFGANAVTCGPEGSGYAVTYAPGDNQRYLFADRSHPSGAGQAIIAGMVVSALAAPLQVSLAGKAGLDAAEAHRDAVAAQRSLDFAQDRPIGSWRAYATGRVGKEDVDVLARLGETRTDMRMITLGASHRAGADLDWGAAVSVARHDSDLSGANLDSTVALGSMHGTWRRGALYLHGALRLGGTSVEVSRTVPLAGTATRSEGGDTTAAQFGGDLGLGWLFGERAGLRHGPFLGVSYVDQEVRGYRESGRSSTAMNFLDFDHDSLIARAGYQYAGRIGAGAGEIRPYARVAYERELRDEPVLVSAGSNTMPGRFTLPGFEPPGQSVSAHLGLSAKMGERASLLADYAGRFGDGSRRSHRLAIVLRTAF